MPRRKTVSDEDILIVARAFFLKDGINASTRSIAQEAGISEAVIFQRFGTKNDLFFAAMVPPQAELEALFDIRPGEGSVVGNVERVGVQLLDYFKRMMPVFLSLISHPCFDMKEFLKRHALPAMQVGTRLVEYLSAEGKLGRVRSENLPAGAAVLISHLHNLALLESVGDRRQSDAGRAVREAVGVLWVGVRPDNAESL